MNLNRTTLATGDRQAIASGRQVCAAWEKLLAALQSPSAVILLVTANLEACHSHRDKLPVIEATRVNRPWWQVGGGGV